MKMFFVSWKSSFLLGLIILSVCSQHGNSRVVQITSPQTLIGLFKNAVETVNDEIQLISDIHFYGINLTLPLGAFSDGTCVPYSGVFRGNGHSIKGLKMNATNNAGYNNAGLFCNLENATVENLIIDSSCSFTGYSAGALSVTATGSLTVTSTTNKASVSGIQSVGGLIGFLQSTVLSFDGCANDAVITGSKYFVGGFVGRIISNPNMVIIISNSISSGRINGTPRYAGGFVGEIYGNTSMIMTISSSINNGIVTGSNYVGGFFGNVHRNPGMTMTISSSINHGVVTGNEYVGGFAGYIDGNTNTNMIISNSINSGIVTGSENNVGGFVGYISFNINMNMTVSNSTNSGISTTERSNVGGFVGCICSSHHSFLTIINSANKGSIFARSGVAYGFVGVRFYSPSVETTVINSINKGSVNAGEYAYGITDNITMARNVVSMGGVTGASGSFTFWNTSTDVDLFYASKDNCFNCSDDATLFQHNTSTGFYEVVENGEHVDDLLNNESVSRHFGMMWTSELELVDSSDSSSSENSIVEYEVRTAQDLIELFETINGSALHSDIVLLSDIDFSGSSLDLPLGAFSNGTCVSFSGVFHGNGHSIQGLTINTRKAGLFCSLKDATVENLVIDSSCSFSGYYAGALSVSVNGSLTVTNTTNKATIIGKPTSWVGGFIGVVQNLKQPTVISFKDCVNDGNITAEFGLFGGFVGVISSNNNMVITVSNCTNNGNATGPFYSGGFVGYISSSTNMTLTVSNSTNNGIVTKADICGGFIGIVYNNITLNIVNSTNNGDISGRNVVGGFAGVIASDKTQDSISLIIINSANKGSIYASHSMACGFMCVDSDNNIRATVKNSINKGSISAGKSAYGITNIVTVARNVVSMGDVTGSSGSYTFWDSSSDVDLFYALKGKCINCSAGATLFQHNTDTGFYEVVKTRKHVDDLLNIEAIKQHYGMVWSSELELVDIPLGPLSAGVYHSVSVFSIVLAFVLTVSTILSL